MAIIAYYPPIVFAGEQIATEETDTKVWIPLHRDLKVLLDQTPHVTDFILNTSWGRLFSSSQSLYEKIKTMLRRIGEGVIVTRARVGPPCW